MHVKWLITILVHKPAFKCPHFPPSRDIFLPVYFPGDRKKRSTSREFKSGFRGREKRMSEERAESGSDERHKYFILYTHVKWQFRRFKCMFVRALIYSKRRRKNTYSIMNLFHF